MGKSKKVKAERINAIRKQYEAFLEEDRKRKDRNEYILERLDKMRSCSAVLQKNSVSKAYDIINFYPLNNEHLGCMERNFSLLKKSENSFDEVHPRNTLTAINERGLLKEISKNYILIPRYTNALEHENKYPIKLNADDNSDWKSKYSILEELKRNEREEQNERLVPTNSKQISSYHNNTELDDIKTEQTYVNVQNNTSKPSIQLLNSVTVETIGDSSNGYLEESNLTSNNNTVLINKTSDKQVDEISHNLINVTNSSDEKKKDKPDILPQIVETGKPATSIIISSSDISSSKESSKISGDHKNKLVEYKEDKDDSNDLTEKEKTQAEYEIKFKSQAELNSKVEDEKDESFKIDNENKIEIESLTESTQPKEIQNQVHSNINETSSDYEKKKLEDNFAAIENTDFSSVKQQHLEGNLQGIADKNDQIYDMNQDINNQYQAQESSKIEINSIDQGPIYDQDHTQQENVDTADENQILEFEAEQNNMFYTEQTDVNYIYDQTGVSNTVQAEYTNNAGYLQDGNYTFYEEAPQEQAYIGGINEHEESNEQYDPHYEEQYGNYEQVIEQNTDIERYITEENVDQQNYDQVQLEKPEHSGVQEVEQQLDTEEGIEEPVNYPNVNNVEPERRITDEESIIT